jgi:hypothetical protein
LTNGSCRVPYLWNYPENSLNTVLCPQDKSDREKGRWSTFDVNTFDRRMFWREPIVPWDEPVYPEELDDEESPSVADEEESGSEFIPSGSASE